MKISYNPKLFLLIFFVIVISYCYPTITNQNLNKFYDGDIRNFSYVQEIPNEIYEVSEFINKNSTDGKTLILPFHDYGIFYLWPKGSHQVKPPFIHTIKSTFAPSTNDQNLTEQLLFNTQNVLNINALIKLNIEYVILEKNRDLRQKFFPVNEFTPLSHRYFEDFLNNSNYFEKIKEYGLMKKDYLLNLPYSRNYGLAYTYYPSLRSNEYQYVIYKFKNKYRRGGIRPSNNANFFNVKSVDLSFDDSLYMTNILVDSNDDIEKITNALKRNIQLPELITNKVSPSLYEIKIKHYKGPFLLETSNSLNTNWSLEIIVNDKKEYLDQKNYFNEMLGTSVFLIDLGDQEHDIIEMTLQYKIKNHLITFIIFVIFFSSIVFYITFLRR